MTRTIRKMPLLAASLVGGALVIGAAGVATAHAPADETHHGAGMHGSGVGHGMQGGHMGSGMMDSHMGGGMMGRMMAMMASHMDDMGGGMMDGGMMGAIDEEAMADIRAQMSELHDQMLELHVQALQGEEDTETDGNTQVEDGAAPAPEDG